jgi:twitching motility protein PilT
MNYETELDDIIMTLVKEKGSDLHLNVGNFPTIRVNRELIPLTRKKELTDSDTLAFLREMTEEKALTNFVITQEADFTYIHRNEYRLRVNASFQRGVISLAIRLVPTVKSLQELGLPEQLLHISRERQGFFVIVGSVGQGKSTTLAAMIEQINIESRRHILTIEDPIEFHFNQSKSIIEQREVGTDTNDFATALLHSLRQDVDVIMIGEMSERETMSSAVTAAETGHLVLATVHSNSAAQTIDRIIDTFPGDEQNQIRLQLASSLIGVLYQHLVPSISGGLVPIFELLLNTGATANLIRDNRTNELETIIETGSDEGMIDLDRYLASLVRKNIISRDTGFAYARRKTLFDRLL